MLLLGIDLGTSSIKVSVVDANSQECLATAAYPETEAEIISMQEGWAEQSPDTWWANTQKAILKAHGSGRYDPLQIGAIGIAYQMHGLVCVDRQQQVLRNSIIWCDSRAVPYGERALQRLGSEYSLEHLLNAPGNFTAAKLAWVKENEPALYAQIDKIMLPGDFLAMKLTGQITTTISALSEGIFWDFKEGRISTELLKAFDFPTTVLPEVKELFSAHGALSTSIATTLQLTPGIPVTYKAGDQPNNALSLNVLQPGEVAATAGTSGVVYGVTDRVSFDPLSRVNSFAHVNHSASQNRIGVLLCINGTGIMNSWLRNNFFDGYSYDAINEAAAAVATGAAGVVCYPFGNGAERILQNRASSASIRGLQLTRHHRGHVARAVQEGIVYALQYGMEIMRQMKMQLKTVRAGHTNMFLSEVFAQSFANTTGCRLELYNTDGSIGAARGAGIGLGWYKNPSDGFSGMKQVKAFDPDPKLTSTCQELYVHWKQGMEQ